MSQDQQSWLPTFISISYGTITGTIIGGIPGGVVAFSSVVIDEYLIYNDYTDKHYFTLEYYWDEVAAEPIATILSNSFPAYGMLINNLLPPIITAANLYFIDDFFNFKDKTTVPLDSFHMINRLFDKNDTLSLSELNHIYEVATTNPIEALSIIKNDAAELYNNPFLTSVILEYSVNILNIITNQIFFSYFAQYSGSLMLQTILTGNEKQKTIGFTTKLVGYFCLKSIGDNIVSVVQSTISHNQFEMIMSKSNEFVMENNNGRKILAHPKGKELNDNFMYDLWMLKESGLRNLNAALTDATQSLFSLKAVITTTPNLLAVYSCTLIPRHALYTKIAHNTKELATNINEQHERLWDVRIDTREHIDLIIMRDGQRYIADKHNKIASQKNSLTSEQSLLTTFYSSISTITGYIHYFIDIFMYIMQYDTGLSIETFPLVKQHIGVVDSYYSSNLHLMISSNNIKISLDRLETVFQIVNEPNNKQATKTFNQDNSINLQNYTLYVDSNQILMISNLSLPLGQTYAFTGKSGCGKTSTFVDIKSGVFGALQSSGQISLPMIDGHKPQIMFFNQKLYLPKGAPLLETVYFPGQLDKLDENERSDLINRIADLMRELEIDEFTHDPSNSKGLLGKFNSTDFQLSGGQEKKLAVIQAILNKGHSDIYFFDESFTGLDPKSTVLVQKALKTYLQNATLIVVDHHAADNNYHSFYDFEVNFANGTARVLEILPRTLWSMNNTTDSQQIDPVEVAGNIDICPLVEVVGNIDTCPLAELLAN